MRIRKELVSRAMKRMTRGLSHKRPKTISLKSLNRIARTTKKRRTRTRIGTPSTVEVIVNMGVITHRGIKRERIILNLKIGTSTLQVTNIKRTKSYQIIEKMNNHRKKGCKRRKFKVIKSTKTGRRSTMRRKAGMAWLKL